MLHTQSVRHNIIIITAFVCVPRLGSVRCASMCLSVRTSVSVMCAQVPTDACAVEAIADAADVAICDVDTAALVEAASV